MTALTAPDSNSEKAVLVPATARLWLQLPELNTNTFWPAAHHFARERKSQLENRQSTCPPPPRARRSKTSWIVDGLSKWYFLHTLHLFWARGETLPLIFPVPIWPASFDSTEIIVIKQTTKKTNKWVMIVSNLYIKPVVFERWLDLGKLFAQPGVPFLSSVETTSHDFALFQPNLYSVCCGV